MQMESLPKQVDRDQLTAALESVGLPIAGERLLSLLIEPRCVTLTYIRTDAGGIALRAGDAIATVTVTAHIADPATHDTWSQVHECPADGSEHENSERCDCQPRRMADDEHGNQRCLHSGFTAAGLSAMRDAGLRGAAGLDVLRCAAEHARDAD